MRKMLAIALIVLIGPTAARAVPLPWREVTYSSYEQGGLIWLRQFDPAQGSLISARADFFGSATFTLETKTPLTQATPYSFKIGYYLYFGAPSFHLFLDGGDTLAPYQPSYMLQAKGKGAETVTGKALDAFKGTKTLSLIFSSDLPKPAPPGVPPGTFTMTRGTGTLSITYRYFPSLKIKPPTGPVPVPHVPNPKG